MKSDFFLALPLGLSALSLVEGASPDYPAGISSLYRPFMSSFSFFVGGGGYGGTVRKLKPSCQNEKEQHLLNLHDFGV